MPTLWTILDSGNSISLCIDAKDRLMIRYNGKVIAKYNEYDETWYGFKNGKMIRIFMPSLKTIAGNYIE